MRSWWKSLSRNQKITLAAGIAVPLVIALFNAVPSYVELFETPTSTTIDRTPFQVSAFEVKRVGQIKADIINADPGEEVMKVKAAFMDITVRNSGVSTTVITGVEFRVKVIEEIDNCEGGGGPLEISAHYSATLPYPFPKTPFPVPYSIKHEVKPNTADRFTFSLGPKVWPESDPDLLLYQVDVLIHHDVRSVGPVFAGTALLSYPIYYGDRYGSGWYRNYFKPSPGADDGTFHACFMKNQEKARRFFQLSGTRSPVLDVIEADLKA